ncbi:MAG: host specificity factor TipJ family phage tail protein [Burkholderiaceae bacterium]
MAVANPPLIVHPHALVGDGRVTVVDAFRDRETLGAYIKRTGVIVPRGPVAVWHNGHRVPDALWRQLIPRTGDQIVIRARLIGGGGGDGNKVLRTVALVALVVATSGVGSFAGLGSMLAGATGMSVGLASAAIMIGGSLLITALLPTPKPTAAQLGTGSKYESSPTYSISGGRNRSRTWEPMSVIFGKHKVVPDYGAKYWTEYVGDDQYLNQVFHFGLQAGSVELSDFKIGDTPISNYQGVQIEVSGLDGKLSMFPGNVDTLQGFVVNNADGWIQRTTPLDTTYISFELAAQLYSVNDDGSISGRSVDARIQYRQVGTGAWSDIGILSDAVYASHYWSLQDANGVQVGAGSTNPSEHYEWETVPGSSYQDCSGEYCVMTRTPDLYWRWVPHPHALGQPWQGRAPDPYLSTSSTPGVRMTGARQEPTRKTVGVSVAKGQYEVRVLKTSGDIKDSRNSNEFAVSQILCYQPDEADYTGQLRVALRIKATNQLNGAVDEFSAIAKASCMVWNGSDWVKQHTRNPAWWHLHFAYGKRAPSGERVYGGGLDNDQIDYDAHKAWAAWCDLKELTFDYVLDRKSSVADVSQTIARAGRASPTWQTGKLGVVWDAADLPVTAMFGPFNIKAGTFKVDYISEGNVDEVVLNFVNEDKNYEMDEVRVPVPGATTRMNPIQLDLDGCTRASMAGRDANLIAASQVWHRRRVSWETDIEGWIAGRGDVVQISHDLTVWGFSGRLLNRSGSAITLTQSVPSGGSGTLLLRGPENQMKSVSVVSEVGDVDVLTITSDMSDFPLPGDEGYEGIEPMDWAWFFDPMQTPGRRFKITDVEPTEDGVRFQAVDDDPGYYASENNPYEHVPPRDGAYLTGFVFGITFAESIVNVVADISNVQIAWALSIAMPVQVQVSINGQAQPAAMVDARNMTIQAQTGDIVSVTVTPKSERGTGTPSTQTYTVQGLTAPLPTLTGLTNVFRDGLTVLVWDRVVDIRQPEYEVRIGDTWDNARPVGVTPMPEFLAVGNGLYWVAARFAFRGTVRYGEPDSLLIAGASLVRNVIIQQDEAPDWTGTVSGGAMVYEGMLTLAPQGDVFDSPDIFAEQDVLWMGGPAASGIYTNAAEDQVDVGYVSPVRIDFEIAVQARNLTADILGAPDIFAIADVLNGSDMRKIKVTPQIRHAQEEGAWTEWRNFVPGLINARYFDVRLLLETSDPLIIPFVTKFKWILDVDDLVQTGTEIVIPAGGMRIDYARHFHTDKPAVLVTAYDAINGDWPKISNADRTGFDVQIFNNTTPKEGVINWTSQGW